MKKAKAEIVFQVGMVVESVDDILNNLRTYFELDEDSIVVKNTLTRAQSGDSVQNTYNGEPVEFYIKTARLNFGGIDFEYVEPLNKEGGDPYSDWLKAHGPGIHHINMKLEDRSIIDKVMAEKNIPPHIWTSINGLELETYDFRQLFGFIGELGDMVVGPMAETYYSDKEKK